MLHNSRIYIIISTLVALAICFMAFKVTDGGIDMDTSLVLALVAVGTALVGVVGMGIAEILKSKKQSGEIRADVGNVKKDTEDIKGEVDKKLVPNLQTISAMALKIDNLNFEVEHQKRIKADMSSNVMSKDNFVCGIEKLYETNGRLENENRELQYQLKQEQEKNQFLSAKISELNAENHKLCEQLRNQERDMQRENHIQLGNQTHRRF